MTANRRGQVLRWLVAAAIVAPPVVAIVVLAGRTWHPVDDFAIIDLRIRDVWSSHPPLTGLFSRPGWSHPGPAMFWLIAPLSGAFGQPTWATHIGGAVLELAAMAWLAWATARAGLRMLLTAAAVIGMTYLGIGEWVIRQPWNLHVPLIWFVLVLFLGLIVAMGRFRQLIALAVASTVVVQTHVGFAVPVGAVVAFALACVVLDVRRTRTAPPRWRSTVLITLALLMVLWLPPILDVVLHWPGNLGKTAAYFADGNYQHVGISQAAGIVAAEFKILPSWLGGSDPTALFTGFAEPVSLNWLCGPAILLLAAGLAAWRTGDRHDRRAVALTTALLMVTVFAISRADQPRAYTFQWRVVVAAFVAVAGVQAITTLLAGRRTAARFAAGAVAVAILLWGTIDLGVRVARPGPEPLEDRRVELEQALPLIRHTAHENPRPVVLVRAVGTSLRSLFDGVINELDRGGTSVRVDADLGRIFGRNRVGTVRGADQVWYVTEQGSLTTALRTLPGARVVFSSSRLTPAENAELDRLQTRLGEQLIREGRRALARRVDEPLIAFLTAGIPGVDSELARRTAELNDRAEAHGRCRCAIVAVPGGRTRTADRIPPQG